MRVRTLAEIRALLAEVGRLLRSRWWLLAFWYCLGWAGHQLGLFGSALLARDHDVLANLIFVVGVVVRLGALVLMVHSLEPVLRFPRRGAPTVATRPRIPDLVFTRESALEATALAIGPFLAVYAVWGFVEDEVRDLFFTNYQVSGLSPENWSINLDISRLPFYLILAAASWLLRQLIARVNRRWSLRWLDVIGILAEGTWAFATFVVAFILAGQARAWLRARVVGVELIAQWNAFLAALPDWHLLFGQTLAELVSTLGGVLPGAVATVLLLPLMWLALTATVYGWRDFRARDVLAGTRAQSRVERLEQEAGGPMGRLALLATDDLRTKYLPVAQAFRLILRAGPRLVGAYLLLATVSSLLDNLAAIGLTVLVGPRSLAVSLLLDPLQDLVVSLVITCVSVALYAAAFDRALGAVLNSAETDAADSDATESGATESGATGRVSDEGVSDAVPAVGVPSRSRPGT